MQIRRIFAFALASLAVILPLSASASTASPPTPEPPLAPPPHIDVEAPARALEPAPVAQLAPAAPARGVAWSSRLRAFSGR